MIFSELAPFVLIAALVLDALVGDPDIVWRRLPHPVVWIGTLIGWLERLLNRSRDPAWLRRGAGIATVGLLIVIGTSAGWLLSLPARASPWGLLIEVSVVAVLVAQRSLYDHVARVRDAFAGPGGGLGAGRLAVSMIVGRDPQTLDEAGVARAAIESAAENFSDGVVAPAFWYLVAGLPGIVVYKAINTADSMIGHRSERYRDFGWCAARLDDVLNLPAARLSGLFVALAAPIAGGSIARALVVMFRDAGKHKSPNAGWPEAAMAGGLGLALAGPRVYSGAVTPDPWLNADGNRAATAADIGRALKVLAAACVAHGLFVAAVAWIAEFSRATG